MKNKTYTLLVIMTLAFVTISNAQGRRYAIKNGIGVQGGITLYDISTDNFETQSNTGWLMGLSAVVDLPNKWYNVSYNIQLSENNVDISAFSASPTDAEFVEYKLLMAQLSLLMHVKLVGSYITFDIGPMLQYNGELELKDDAKENYTITGFDNLLAEDIAPITKFNVNGAVGLSAGYGAFRVRAHYIYGFTNMLNKLNDENLNVPNSENFKGNQSMFLFTLMFTL
ncbi:MAG: hypothetical protein AAF901_03880 [Bacteroidota bacterium]